jgi:hypothetical protein
MRRRGGRRQKAGSTPATVGTALREAREASGVELSEIQDRTGIPWPQLEALEGGNLSLFPDLRSAVTAVRRYSDLVELDVDGFARVVEEHWGTAPAGFDGAEATGTGGNGGGRAPGGYLTGPVYAGHLSRYPGDGTHLRAFTQTDEVPGVRRTEASPADSHSGTAAFSATGTFPSVPRRFVPVRAAPLVLQGAVWVTAILLVVAGAGLAVAHYQRQWLADIHVVRHSPSATSKPSAPSATSHTNVPSGPAHTGPVTLAQTGVASATVSVHASNYSVVVGAWARCWTVVHTPQSFSPVFAGTLAAGQVKVFNPANGQLSLSMSASLVTVQVRIGGKDVPGFLFKPTSVPYTLDFNSTAT